MLDRRDEILNSVPEQPDDLDRVWTTKEAHAAMDEYMKEVCLELLEYMARNDIKCEWSRSKGDNIVCSFYFKGEWLSKEQLFENFL